MRPIARFVFLISVLGFHIEPELAELGAVPASLSRRNRRK
jgi:hypothetical protein